MTYKEMEEEFEYDMARLKKKQEKLRRMGEDPDNDESIAMDYAELTVTDDEFEEEEKQRFEKFL